MKHGLLSGLASAAGGSAIEKYGGNWSRAAKVAANAIVGGTVEELGGGKFANGAITGAFSMLFNDLMHNEEDPPTSQDEDSVGQPGEWESIIPIWGSGRAAIDYYQTGHPWKGTLQVGLAIPDKGTISLAGKYALRKAIASPQAIIPF